MLSPDLLDMLRQWWKAARPQGWLFPGRPAINPLTTRQLNRIFHLAAEAAEIKTGATLHTLRHSFATHLLESQLDIRMIQALLGHKRLDTTAHYTRIATEMISKVVSPFRSARQEDQEGRAAEVAHGARVRYSSGGCGCLRDHGAAWRDANRGHVSLGQLKVMSAIERCRTAALGGHVARCETCPHTVIGYNRCRNRRCPSCRARRHVSGSPSARPSCSRCRTFMSSTRCRARSPISPTRTSA